MNPFSIITPSRNYIYSSIDISMGNHSNMYRLRELNILHISINKRQLLVELKKLIVFTKATTNM